MYQVIKSNYRFDHHQRRVGQVETVMLETNNIFEAYKLKASNYKFEKTYSNDGEDWTVGDSNGIRVSAADVFLAHFGSKVYSENEFKLDFEAWFKETFLIK